VPTPLGAHNPRIAAVRALQTKKGRAEQGRFAFEGSTLLEEACDAGVVIEELYVTAAAMEQAPLLARLEAGGVPVFTVEERAMARISEVETPPGIIAVAATRYEPPSALLANPGLVLLLADLGDPGNAGTLLRSAEAFGARGVIAGSLGAELYLPKVVRAAMGALFRLSLAVCAPGDLAGLLDDWEVTGLCARGVPLEGLSWGARRLVIVGSERQGLGRWEPLCGRLAAISMPGKAESLNAAVAGSIALYEAEKRTGA
jgi:TrmH family RNA methyltransferase